MEHIQLCHLSHCPERIPEVPGGSWRWQGGASWLAWSDRK